MNDRAKIVAATFGIVCLISAVVAAWAVWPPLIGWTLAALEAGIIVFGITEIVCVFTGWRWNK